MGICPRYDANLSDRGEEEAAKGGRALRDEGMRFDLAFTSFLIRPQKTLDIILDAIGQKELPVMKTWRLNERHYGNLTGLNKAETAEKYGEAQANNSRKLNRNFVFNAVLCGFQVKVWRRDFNIPPPEILPENPYYDSIMNDPRYC